MKKMALILTFVFLYLTSAISIASDDDDYGSKTYNFTLPTTYTTEKVDTGLALSMGAAAIDCTMTSKKWQLGGGIGYYDDKSAPVIGACKKFSGALFKATIGREDGITGGNVGVMFLLE